MIPTTYPTASPQPSVESEQGDGGREKRKGGRTDLIIGHSMPDEHLATAEDTRGPVAALALLELLVGRLRRPGRGGLGDGGGGGGVGFAFAFALGG